MSHAQFAWKKILTIGSIVSVRLSSQGKDEVAREIKRSSAATDAGHAMRRYLAETLVHDPFTDPSVKFPRQVLFPGSIMFLDKIPTHRSLMLRTSDTQVIC